MKRRFNLAEISQGDLFPNRETVGTENEVVMVARFDRALLGGIEGASRNRSMPVRKDGPHGRSDVRTKC